MLKFKAQIYLYQGVVLDLPIVVNEKLFRRVIVERVDELQPEDELVPLGPDVVDVLVVAVV